MTTLYILLAIGIISFIAEKLKLKGFSFSQGFWFIQMTQRRIRLSFWGFGVPPTISIEVSGDERELRLHLGWGIGIQISLEHILPKSWYPSYISDTYGVLPTEKEISLSFHDWTFFYRFWRDSDTWKAGDSRDGHLGLEKLLFGKHVIDNKTVDTGKFILPFLEGNYEVCVTKTQRTDKWQRWFTRTMIVFEVECHKGLPHEGKGENSWDCGEDATYSQSFPGTTILGWRKIDTTIDAALYFWVSSMQTRVRYSNWKWRPEKFKKQPIEILNKELKEA